MIAESESLFQIVLCGIAYFVQGEPYLREECNRPRSESKPAHFVAKIQTLIQPVSGLMSAACTKHTPRTNTQGPDFASVITRCAGEFKCLLEV